MKPSTDKNELGRELEETRARLAEAEDALNAIRNGEVDGLVIAGPDGQQVFTLKGAEEPYRLLIERMSEGALMLSGGVILYANRTFEQLLQTPPGAAIGAEFKAFVSPPDRQALADLIEAAQTGISRGRINVCAADGSIVPLRLGLAHLQWGSETLLSLVATDLTEISKKEEELRSLAADLEKRVAERTADLAASRLAALNIMEDAVAARASVEHAESELARLGAAVEQTADSIVITDTKGNIQYVNPAFERITGYTKAEVLNRNPSILKSGKTEPAVYEKLWKTITNGESWTGNLINRRKDGTLFEERVSISVLYDEAHEIINYIAVKQDVSHLILLEDQLRQSQKMEAIGQLAGGVAHDFNNLLTAINGYSALALRLIGDNPTLESYLEEIKKAGERAANLTRQLLAFGRKQMLLPISLNLNGVVSDMNKMLRRLIGEDIQLAAKLDPALRKIKADPGQIEQVLVNLVVNARDAMPKGGHLTIETTNAEIDGKYVGGRIDVQPGSYVVLAVSDTGCGIDEETKARIFEPFFTTKEKGKGTGLGLSTVYGIVRQSGGNIWVYSEVGQGTTFKVYLPIDTAAEPVKQPVVELATVAGSETILVVEDEDVVRGLARKILEDAGYRVLDANGGAEAIRVCQAYEGPIDLLLTDVVMPNASGKEVADQLTLLRPTTRVLFMSGYADEAIVHQGIVDLGVEFIQKPFGPVALTNKVREVLDRDDSPGASDR